MRRVSVRIKGFLGDTMFATAVLEHPDFLKRYDAIEVVIDYPQTAAMLGRCPKVGRVSIRYPNWTGRGGADVINLGPIVQDRFPTLQMISQANLSPVKLGYGPLRTDPLTDKIALSIVENYDDGILPTIGVVQNWRERSFGFTKAEYERGEDVHLLGYGGRHRDIEGIVEILECRANIVPIGMNDGFTQAQGSGPGMIEHFNLTASIIKHLEYVVGPEGGMTNLAAGLGTPVIYTTDFIHQLYGPKGSVRPCLRPRLGPCEMFPSDGHTALDPYLSDDDVARGIIEIINMDEEDDENSV